MISDFHGEHRWLSNFYIAGIKYEGTVYPSAEHAYQAAKFETVEKRQKIADLNTAAKAKRAGEAKTGKRPDWAERKLVVMEAVLREKFKRPELRYLLLGTGEEELVEGNDWGDVFWGVCKGKGENHLGKLLMKIRKELHESGRLEDKETHRSNS